MNPFKHLFLCVCLLTALPAAALSIAAPDESFIYRFDRNDDSKLNLQEFLAIKLLPDSKWIVPFAIDRQSFTTLDRNQNGYLDSQDQLPIDYKPEVYRYIQCWPQCEPQ